MDRMVSHPYLGEDTIAWNEIEIEKLIKINRNFLNKEIGREYKEIPLFINPTKESPVETPEFLSHLNLEFMDSLLKEMFPRFERIKQRVYARIKLVIYMTLKGEKYITDAYRKLQTNREVAENLGFNPDNLPSYETIRHFINEILQNKIEEIFYAVVKEIQKQLKRNGEWDGRIIEDAVVITAKRGDDEADYSGYYKT